MATTPAPSKSANTGQAQQKQAAFRAGTQPTVFSTGFTFSQALTTAPAQLQQIQIPANNILRCLYLEVKGVTSGNSAAVAFEPDAPLNIFNSINFADAAGNSIVGTFDSYKLAMAMKYGSYSNNADPRASAVYSATTGTGATGGSFNMVFRIPVEIRNRDAVGSLQNQTSNSPLTLQMTLNASTAIYSTAPTAQPTVTVTLRLGGYWKGDNSAAASIPKAFGSTQYWNMVTAGNGLSGSQQFTLPPNGIGEVNRNWVFLNYATGGNRSSADFPDPLEIDIRGNRFVQYSQNLWLDDMSRDYGYYATSLDSANGLDTGVFAIPFTKDFTNSPGDENGNGYLMTNIGDSIQLLGSWSASSTLYWLNNYVAVSGSPTAIQP
jgi:hypothetical protein